MSNKSEAAILKNLEKLAVHNDPIDQKLYSQYDVKRGLRNANGTGVLVGLTRIGDVVGYELKDGQKIAIPGRLVYRGYNVEAESCQIRLSSKPSQTTSASVVFFLQTLPKT